MTPVTITAPAFSPPDTILSKAAVAARIGVSPSTIDRWLKAGAFVPRIRLGEVRVGFSERRVEEWINSR